MIPTFNPHSGRLLRTLEGLRRQSLPVDQWELVLIDNASTEREAFDRADLSWHPNARIVREDKLGLTPARLRGFSETKAPLIVMVDDDNVLGDRFLEEATALMDEHPRLGAIGGRVLPEFETPPEPWAREFLGNLALRDHGDEPLLEWHDLNTSKASRKFPKGAPVGAGMVLRREALNCYLAREIRSMDRQGNELTSGGDNDIVMCLLEEGWGTGYFPSLGLIHLIPSGRVTREYFGRLTRGIAKSWVVLLDNHGCRPWPRMPRWLLPLVKARAWVRHRAWSGDAEWVRWQNACGYFEGRALLPRNAR
jgi:glycosyltransferase involved in cell wall biosynthesis